MERQAISSLALQDFFFFFVSVFLGIHGVDYNRPVLGQLIADFENE